MYKKYFALNTLLLTCCFLTTKNTLADALFKKEFQQNRLKKAASKLSGIINESSNQDTAFSIKELSPIKLAQKALREALSIKLDPIEPISVRPGKELGSVEKKIIAQRQPEIKQAIESLVKKSLADEEIPSIAIAASGGGDRAMISFLAYVTALEELNILPACSYAATLSGSTWSLSSWLAHGKPLSEMKKIFYKHEVETTLLTMDHSAMAKSIIKKFAYGQSISACDFWGAFLADGFFNEHELGNQTIRLSSLKNATESGKYPFPLFTSSISGITPYEWMEYSPFEIGSDFLQAWIPTETFGKKFNNGVTTDPAPEQTLGYMLGLFGSAYAANIRDIFVNALPALEKQMNNLMTKKGIKKSLAELINTKVVSEIKELVASTEQKKILDTARVSPATIPNFTFGMEGHQFSTSKKLKLMDGAFAFNLPFPPLLRRNINLYLVCNAKKTYGPLKKAEEYARRKGYKFPEIPAKDGDAPSVSLFYDAHDPEVPVIVYIPLSYITGTTQMIYKDEEFNSVFDAMYNSVKKAKITFIKALRIALNNKRKLLKQQHAVIAQPER